MLPGADLCPYCQVEIPPGRVLVGGPGAGLTVVEAEDPEDCDTELVAYFSGEGGHIVDLSPCCQRKARKMLAEAVIATLDAHPELSQTWFAGVEHGLDTHFTLHAHLRRS